MSYKIFARLSDLSFLFILDVCVLQKMFGRFYLIYTQPYSDKVLFFMKKNFTASEKIKKLHSVLEKNYHAIWF